MICAGVSFFMKGQIILLFQHYVSFILRKSTNYAFHFKDIFIIQCIQYFLTFYTLLHMKYYRGVDRIIWVIHISSKVTFLSFRDKLLMPLSACLMLIFLLLTLQVFILRKRRYYRKELKNSLSTDATLTKPKCF